MNIKLFVRITSLSDIFILIAIASILMACGSTPPMQSNFEITAAEAEKNKLLYYSDYFSFVGEDEHGKVAFAIDNNRGRDGELFQADHFVVLHDENKGWIDIQGNGLYPNTSKSVKIIPDSEFFSFSGKINKDFIIHSKVNNLTLKTHAMSERIRETRGQSIYVMRSGDAELKWQGRKITGRVIYEYLYFPSFNRLSRKYFGVFKDFHGIYARVDKAGDFYLHLQKSKDIEPLIGFKKGFAFIDNKLINFDKITVQAKERIQGAGFYRWPKAWQGEAIQDDIQLNVSINVYQQNNLFNWIIGAFAMSIVKGEIIINGERKEIYGFGEMIL